MASYPSQNQYKKDERICETSYFIRHAGEIQDYLKGFERNYDGLVIGSDRNSPFLNT